jgi:hypothetical protein
MKPLLVVLIILLLFLFNIYVNVNTLYNLSVYSTPSLVVNDVTPKDWLKSVYHCLQDEKLLTKNVKSKEHIWKKYNISLSRRISKKALVYLGWVAYWVCSYFYIILFYESERIWRSMH